MTAAPPRPTTLSGGPASRDDLGRRAEGLPRELSRVLGAPLPQLPAGLAGAKSYDVTGIGASEGPARLLTRVLVGLGKRARFVPAAAFVEPQGDAQTALIVFSQGLCPNARLALRQVERYGAALLFTTVLGEEHNGPLKGALLQAFQKAGGGVWTHAPEREGGSLVRLVGPACALLAALRWSTVLTSQTPAWGAELGEVPARVAHGFAESRTPLGADPVALLATARLAPLLPSLAWKWQEALFSPLAHAFDVLSFMHGPLQSLHGRPSTLVLCTNQESPAELELLERLRRVLAGEPHRLIELGSSLTGPLAWFELDAVLNRLVLLEMDARQLDPGHWPAQGHDAPLYQVGE